MQQKILKKIQYTIPSGNATTVAENGKENQFIAAHLPLMKVFIDFETGMFHLDGDWHYMMRINEHNNNKWFSYQRERIKIRMNIIPLAPVNLDDPINDGIIFPMEGNIKDEICYSACTGLLVLDQVHSSVDEYLNQWDVSFYIYDNQYDGSEIRFKLPLHISFYNENNN